MSVRMVWRYKGIIWNCKSNDRQRKTKEKGQQDKQWQDKQHSTEKKKQFSYRDHTKIGLGSSRSTSGIWRVRNERWATLWCRKTEYIRGHLWHKYNNNTWSTSASYYYNYYNNDHYNNSWWRSSHDTNDCSIGVCISFFCNKGWYICRCSCTKRLYI